MLWHLLLIARRGDGVTARADDEPSGHGVTVLREKVLLSGHSEPYTALGADEDPSRCRVRTWK